MIKGKENINQINMDNIPSSHSSKNIILEKLLREDLTPIHIADKMKIGVSTVRDHLKTMHKKGYVEYYFKRASRGRPKKKYSITKKGRSLFPRKYKLVLSLLLNRMKTEFGEERLQDLFKKVAEDATDLDNNLTEKSIETRIKKLVSFFEKQDLYPSLEKENKVYLIEYGNCGNLEIIEDFHDYLCYMHKNIISNYLPECKIEHVKCFAWGDEKCAHKITPKKK